jgi:hypothetical protein
MFFQRFSLSNFVHTLNVKVTRTIERDEMKYAMELTLQVGIPREYIALGITLNIVVQDLHCSA